MEQTGSSDLLSLSLGHATVSCENRTVNYVETGDLLSNHGILPYQALCTSTLSMTGHARENSPRLGMGHGNESEGVSS